MIRIARALTAVLALSACQEDDPTASDETTTGGIEYRLIQLSENENVTIQVAWPTDWAYREGVNQAAPYIGVQLILSGGADGHPAGEVVERFADLNAEGNLTPTTDHILGELTFERSTMAETVEIANAHLVAPTLEEAWFARIRDGIAQNMAEARVQPVHRSFDAARWAVFGDHPLRNALSLDEPGTFESLTRDDVVAWHLETITRVPEAIVIAGDLNAEEAGSAIDALFDGLPKHGGEITRQVDPNFSPRRILLHMPGAETTNLAFIAPLPATRLGKEFEDLIISQTLGGGDQSVLFEAVRTGLRASYDFGSGINNYTREHRILFLTGAVETNRLAETEMVVREAYAAFLATGPSGALSDRTAPLEAHLANLSDYVVDQARTELQSALDGFETGRTLALPDELATVTEASIAERLAADYPRESAFLVIAVSSDATALPAACVVTTPRAAADCP